MSLSTSLRMYSAGPRAAAAWRALFVRVFDELGLGIRLIEHRWPDPVEQLWARADLCCDFMCGWPFQRAGGVMQPIAAPVPSPPAYAGLPRYRSEFLVRKDSGWSTLEQTFGQRFGWMVANSQSGFNAPRAHLALHARQRGGRLFREVHGPLGTPARTLEALRSSAVDVVALDSFWLDLARRHQPEALANTRCVDATAWTPIPLLVAAPGVDGRVVESLRARLTELHLSTDCSSLLDDVLVERFVAPEPVHYEALQEMAQRSKTLGYEAIR